MKFIKMGYIFLLMAVMVVSGCSAPDDGQNEVSERAKDLGIDVVSTSFDDFGSVFCDPNSTAENISILVDEVYKGNFVQWSGAIYAVTYNGPATGSYTVQVRHCPNSLSDAAVTFNSNENEAVSKLIVGQEITYIGRVTRYQDRVGFWVEEAYLVPK